MIFCEKSLSLFMVKSVSERFPDILSKMLLLYFKRYKFVPTFPEIPFNTTIPPTINPVITHDVFDGDNTILIVFLTPSSEELGVGKKYVLTSNSTWARVTITQNFGYAYFLGIDPSTQVLEAKLLMGKTYHGDMSISGEQAHLNIKMKDSSYYFTCPGGYVVALVNLISNGCTIDTVDSVPSDATDVVIDNQ